MDAPSIEFHNPTQNMEVNFIEMKQEPPDYQYALSGTATSRISSAWIKHQCGFNIAIVVLLLMTLCVAFASLMVNVKSSDGTVFASVTSSYVDSSRSREMVYGTPEPTVTPDPLCRGRVYDVAAIAPPGTTGINVTWEQALDENDPSTLILSSQNSGDYFLIGVTTVFSTFMNAQQKHFNCNFDVTVIPAIPRDCNEAKLTHHNPKDGIFLIQPILWHPERPFPVWCDQTTDGGGWTVFQRRRDGSVNFHRNWVDYKNGFGQLDNEFWLGNEKIHSITSQQTYELKITLSNMFQTNLYASYNSFAITNETDHYTLSLGTFRGNTGYDSFTYHRGREFSTLDVDNDEQKLGNCALPVNRGGWWYKNCLQSDLNGAYNKTYGIDWIHLIGGRFYIHSTEMKIRPVQ